MKHILFSLLFLGLLLAACTPHRTEPRTFSWEEIKQLTQDRGYWDAYRNPDGPARTISLSISPDSNVLTDSRTGLFWQRGSSDRIPTSAVQAYVDSLNSSQFGGYSDWRTPTVEELYSILENTRNEHDRLYLNPLFDNSKIKLTSVFPNQAMLISCDEVILTLLDKTPIGTSPLYIDFAAGMSCGAAGLRAVRAVRH
ncbi:MAG: DUF1566 domain-containing protein [Bacteroidetes bacterium]|nr:MAG: DUF1566 domain-containing protein [Bacteroidota bacterium]